MRKKPLDPEILLVWQCLAEVSLWKKDCEEGDMQSFVIRLQQGRMRFSIEDEEKYEQSRDGKLIWTYDRDKGQLRFELIYAGDSRYLR